MKLELKIIDLLAKNTEKIFTINEIAKSLDEYYSFVHRIVNKLAKEKIIIKNKAGKSYLCTLNIENEKTIILLQLSEIEKLKEIYTNKELKLILDDFVKSVKLNKNITAIILFGSYAKRQETKESDIDILIISKTKFNIEKITKNIYAQYGKDITPIIMISNDFKKQKDKAVIKDIIKNHYILYGAENFVNLVYKK